MLNANYAADLGGSPSGATDVQTELTALKADVQGLMESVQRLAGEAPGMAKDSLEAAIRRQPMQGALTAAAVGFVAAMLLKR